MKKTGIKVEEVSAKFVRENKSNCDYNRASWQERVDRFKKFPGTRFYYAKPQNGYEYERFYVEYSTNEGLRFLRSLSLISSLSGAGFKRAWVVRGEILIGGFGELGEQGVVNSREGRVWLRENICSLGIAITNEF